MAIVIGDIHGCYKTFLALLKKLPDDKIFLVGDLVDRGPRSRQVVSFLIKHPEIESTMGNHEKTALDCFTNARFGQVISWTSPRNGGQETINSYRGKKSQGTPIYKLLPKSHHNYLSNLPQYIIEGDLFISHSSYCGFNFECPKTMEEISTWDTHRSLLWHRGDSKKVIIKGKEYFHIFGHTPIPGVEIKEHYANIDTGACFWADKNIGYGILTAIQYPSMKIWTQEYID